MIKFLQRLALLAAFAVLPWATNAQGLLDYDYATSVDSTMWRPVASTTSLVAMADGAASTLQSFGFSFPFAGQEYTQFSVNSDGNLRLGSTVTGTNYYSTPFNSSNANQNNPKINFFGCDGYTQTGHYIYAETQGTEPNRVCVVEYCIGTFNSTTRGNFYKWQVQLYENGNIIVVYGDEPTANPNVAREPGLCVNSSDLYVVNDSHVATHYTAGAPANTCPISTWPEKGRYYNFFPVVANCDKPTNLTMSNLTLNSATFTWTDAIASSWRVYYFPASYMTQIDSVTVYSTSHTLTNLQPNTSYVVKVASVCPDSTTSNMLMCNFTTPCAPTPLPITEDFDANWSTSGSDPIPSCWNKCYITSTSTSLTSYPYASTSQHHSGTKSLYMYGSTTASAYLALPFVEPTVDSLLFSGWLYKATASYKLIVGAMTDATDISTFVGIDTITPSATSTWEYFEIPLSSYNGNGHVVALKSYNGTIYVDDISLDIIPTCFHPVDLAVNSLTAYEADLVWSPVGTPSSWTIEYSTTDFTPGLGTGTVLTSTNTTVSLTDLQPQTTYYVYVRANCSGDDVSSYEGISFTTPCVPLTLADLPYTEDFESYSSGSTNSIDPCWTKGTSNTTAYPYPYTTNAINGDISLYFYGYYPSTSTSTAYYSYAALPQVDASIDMSDLTISFKARRYSSTTTYYWSRIAVGVMTDPNDIATFDTVQIIDLTAEEALSIHEIDVDMASYTGAGKYAAILCPVPPLNGTTYSYNYFYIDDVELLETPACPRPSAAQVVSVGAEDATISWHENGTATSWTIEYGPEGFTQGGNDAMFVYANDTIATLTGMMPNVDYVAYIHAECSSEMSPARVLHFRTSCVTLTAEDLPYTEDFEAYGTGATATIDPCWYKYSSSTTAYPYPYSTNVINGARSLYFYSYKTSNYYCYAVLPEIDANLPVSSLTIGFNARRHNTTTYNSQIAVGVMTDPTDISTFDTIQLVDLTNEAALSVHNFEIDLTSYTGNGHYVALYSPAPAATASANYNYIYIDDIMLMETPSCRRPDGLEVSNITASTATVTWNAGTASAWTVEYSDGDITPGNGEGEIVYANTNSVSLSGLHYDRTYTVYVHSDCGGDTSTNAMISFRTGCIQISESELPYFEDFEDYGSTSTSPISACWHKGTNSSTAYPYPSSTAPAGSRSLYFYSTHNTSSTGTSYYCYATLPEVASDLDIADLTLNFLARRYSSTSDNYHSMIGIGVMTDPTDIATLDTLQIIDLTNEAASSNHELTIDLGSYQGNGHYVTFFAPMPPLVGTSVNYNYIYIDNVTLMETPTCFHPENLTQIGATDEEITLSWSPFNGVMSDFIIEYGETGFTEGTGDFINVVADTVYTLNSLNSNTIYDIYVRADCGGGDESNSTMITAYTIGAAPETEMPYLCDFSDSSIYSGWSLINGNQTNKWAVGNAAFYPSTESEDSTALYISNNGGESNAYTITSISYVYAFRDFQIPAGEYSLSFDWKANGESTYDWVRAFVVPTSYFPTAGVLPAGYTSASTFNTIVPEGWVDLGGGKLNLHNTWQHVDTSFSVPEGVYRFMFLWTNDASSGAQDPAVIDNISIVRHVCPTPANLVASNILSNTITLSWDAIEANTWKIAYDTMEIVTNDSTYTITGLESNTDYTFYVNAICATDESATTSISIHTPCDPVALPWSENFDSVTTFTSAATGVTMPCWNSIMTGTATYQTATYMPQVYYSATYANSGSYSYRLYGIGYHFLPLLPTTIDSVSFSISTYTSSLSYKLQLVAVEDTGYTVLADLSAPTTSTHNDYTLYLNDYTGNSRQLALYNYNTTATTYYSYYYIDDLSIDYIPTCIPPVNMAVDAASQISATITWEGTSISYDIEYGPEGFTQGQGTTLTSTTNSVALAGLTANTGYDIYVRGNCGGNDLSIWSMLTFRTECDVITTLPWHENFDSITTVTTAATSVHPYCWDYIMTGSATYQGNTYQPQLYYSSTYAHSGMYTLRLYGVSYTMLPETSEPINNLMLDFWSRTSNASYGLIVGAMEDSLFVPIDTIDYVSTSTTDHYTVYLNGYTGNSHRIALQNYYVSTSTTTYDYSYHYIDDITIDYMPSCMPVVDVISDSSTQHAIVLDWTSIDPTSNAWQIEYGVAGFTQGQGTTVNATSHPVTINGLNASTAYEFFVRSDCGSGEYSDWSTSYITSTECDVMSLPYVQSFDHTTATTYNTEGTLPTCWNSYSNGTTAAYTPHVVGSGSYWYADSANALVMTSGSTATYGNLKLVRLPLFSTPVNQMQLTFWMSTESNSYGTLSVGYFTGSDLENDFVSVKDIPASADTYHGTSSGISANGLRDTVTFDSVPNDAMAIGFRWYHNSTYYSCCIDDVTVTTLGPSCGAPVLATSSVTYETANVAWAGSSDTYEIALKEQTGGEWPEGEAIATNSYTFTNLMPATTYLYRVRQICDTDLISDWAVGSFTTDSLPCLAPETFSNTGVGFTSASFAWTTGTTENHWGLRVWNTTFDSTYVIVDVLNATINGLIPGVTYNAAIQALCGNNGNIASLTWSDTLDFTTNMCDAVSGVTTTVNGQNVTISWTPGSNNNGAWEVLYGLDGFGQGDEIANLPATTNSITINNLECYNTYDVYVRAKCEEGVYSAWSDKVTFYIDCTGIHSADGDANVSIFPNPATGNTTISLAGLTGEVSLAIVDMNGRVVRTDSMECDGTCVKTVNVDNLASGAYFVRVTSDSYSTVKKLIVK